VEYRANMLAGNQFDHNKLDVNLTKDEEQQIIELAPDLRAAQAEYTAKRERILRLAKEAEERNRQGAVGTVAMRPAAEASPSPALDEETTSKTRDNKTNNDDPEETRKRRKRRKAILSQRGRER
jgi:hypothetical protein